MTSSGEIESQSRSDPMRRAAGDEDCSSTGSHLEVEQLYAGFTAVEERLLFIRRAHKGLIVGSGGKGLLFICEVGVVSNFVLKQP